MTNQRIIVAICSLCKEDVKRAKICANCGAVFQELVLEPEGSNLTAPVRDGGMSDHRYGNQWEVTLDNYFFLCLILIEIQALALAYEFLAIFFDSDLKAFLSSSSGVLLSTFILVELPIIWALYRQLLWARYLQSILSLISIVIVLLLYLNNTALLILLTLFMNVYILFILLFRGMTKFQL